jgi:hypothetical protein
VRVWARLTHDAIVCTVNARLGAYANTKPLPPPPVTPNLPEGGADSLTPEET